MKSSLCDVCKTIKICTFIFFNIPSVQCTYLYLSVFLAGTKTETF